MHLLTNSQCHAATGSIGVKAPTPLKDGQRSDNHFSRIICLCGIFGESATEVILIRGFRTAKEEVQRITRYLLRKQGIKTHCAFFTRQK